MITSIEVGDFLSHSNTKLEFENGVTVFVGDNGSGKSSIIDAITFALFGQHTRKSNKSLVRRGANQGFARIEFSINDQQYKAERKMDSKGALDAVFSKIVDGKQIQIAAGERRQFDESMTREIEKTIGINFEKLRMASIVQQGELNAIINAKPKEFKELLNAIIGIDKLDTASESMKRVIEKFREGIKEKFGYDDKDIKRLTADLEEHQKTIAETKPQREQLKIKQQELKIKIDELGKKIDIESPKIEKINHLESQKKELAEYAKNATRKIQLEISENERKIRECEGCFERIRTREELEEKTKKVKDTIEETAKKIQDMKDQSASLKEKQLLASKLQLKDNKCPVCDSNVEKLNPLFQEKHLKEELVSLQGKIITAEKDLDLYRQKKNEFADKLQDARDAETTLRAHSIKTAEELEEIQEHTRIKKQKIPPVNGGLAEISQIDPHAQAIFENILKLEADTKGFDEQEFANLKASRNQKQGELSATDQQMGAISEKISKSEEQIKAMQGAISELGIVKEYVKSLDQIQASVFSRDGPVATSLRSWALGTVSAKASEYLTQLDTKIQRIQLSEKTRDVSITCYLKSEVLELESLSGGEKVSVALALRLGMAHLLGTSNLNLMIFDEPTMHLDAKRKKSLVELLAQLSNSSNSEIPMQFLIITHDAEIFDDSTVETIYRFGSSEIGSKAVVS